MVQKPRILEVYHLTTCTTSIFWKNAVQSMCTPSDFWALFRGGQVVTPWCTQAWEESLGGAEGGNGQTIYAKAA